MTRKTNPGKALARLLARRQADSERRELRKAGAITSRYFGTYGKFEWKFPGKTMWLTRTEALAHCRRASKRPEKNTTHA